MNKIHSFLTLLFVLITCNLQAQDKEKKLKSISVGYFGEMITHPGFKVSLSYHIFQWENEKKNNKTIKKSVSINPSIGGYYHRRYQTGIVALPEFAYNRTNSKGNSFSIGSGAGYLRTFIPNTYKVTNTGDVKKVNAGYNYFMTNVFMSFDKKLKWATKNPVHLYIKPQFMYALPNFPNGVGYFALEIGLKYSLK
ncbi:hypothetical protein [Yeosuana marina]|uniref:hypothetical protein n=1 Tax=Yeosuana marina TaxID=1565536 RepID=UPI0030EE18BC|tara:strand:+ start:1856 stop:2440 length:585 start_codon:yes stop_codon:yes gene_type:complete